ncbi:MAG TPA: outer membrane beta-barrel protein [Kofleriaceae bacterium]|nr:outer membrane beta-barrel protein [Kofleriaceae bacterium]
MRRTVLLAAALSTGMAARAARADDTVSSDTLVGGVQAGISASSWIGETDDTTHLGALLGGFARYRFTPQLSAQVELAMHDAGADFETDAGSSVDEALLYLELPLLGRFDLALSPMLSLHGVAGVAPALLMDSKQTPRDEMRAFDLQAHGGVGVDIQVTRARAVSADLRASFGMLDAADDDRKARTLAVTLLAGVTL